MPPETVTMERVVVPRADEKDDDATNLENFHFFDDDLVKNQTHRDDADDARAWMMPMCAENEDFVVGSMTPPRTSGMRETRGAPDDHRDSEGADATAAAAFLDDDFFEPLVDGFDVDDVDDALMLFRGGDASSCGGGGGWLDRCPPREDAGESSAAAAPAASSGKGSDEDVGGSGSGSSSASSARGRKRAESGDGVIGAESEAERQLRLSRNRESAQNSRARKREYVRDLEKRARALDMQNGELQTMVMHLTNENHALRMSLQQVTTGGGAMPTMMMPCVYPPMTPKLPLPPMGAEPAAAVEAPPSPQLEVKKPTTKRRKQTVAASVTALALGALSVVGVTSPGSPPAAAGTASRSSGRRLLALSAPPPTKDPLVRFGVNVTSLREEIARTDDERVFALPDAATTRGLAAWGDKTLDGRAVDVIKPSNVNDPWFSAFKSAGMPEHVNLLSRVSCKEVFTFKGADRGASVATRTNADAWPRERRDEDAVERGQYSSAIPMLSGKENETSIPEHEDTVVEDADEESLVSVLLPPPIEGVVQQLSKLFVVTFNKRTTDYTTHSCLMPQPMTSANRHL